MPCNLPSQKAREGESFWVLGQKLIKGSLGQLSLRKLVKIKLLRYTEYLKNYIKHETYFLSSYFLKIYGSITWVSALLVALYHKLSLATIFRITYLTDVECGSNYKVSILKITGQWFICFRLSKTISGFLYKNIIRDIFSFLQLKHSWLGHSALAYLNIGSRIGLNGGLRVRGSPLLHEIIREATHQVAWPKQEALSVLEGWRMGQGKQYGNTY